MTGYWLAEPRPEAPAAPLAGDADADVAIVGGGYTGLWTALQLVEREPGLRVVLCEAGEIGAGASGRNGGFYDPSLTHGLPNGLAHFGEEASELERLAAANDAGLRAFLEVHRIDCDFEATGMLDVAVEPWQARELAELAGVYAAHGQDAELLTGREVREHLHSPRLLAGLWRPGGGGVLHPAKLARGLGRVAAAAGVALHEHTPVTRVERDGAGVVARTPAGRVRASRLVLATNAYSHRVLRRTARHFVPVHDYMLVSAPLTGEAAGLVGWKHRQGVADAGNQFHYLRLVRSPQGDRILWGGYDAVYHFGSRVGPRYDHRPATAERLERHFRVLFPQLGDLAFPYRWGGPIATTTRFTPVFGDALGGRVLYALGYTGLGVAATRFAARVLTERILDVASPLLRLRYVRSSPVPFPPEPLRWVAVTAVRRALARADARGGRRGPLLAALDRFGVGFDS